MKKPCFILISIFILCIFSKTVMADENFDSLCNKVCNATSFSESGVMMQYNTSNSVREEISILKDIIKNKFNNKGIDILSNEIKVTNKNFTIDINVYDEEDVVETDINIINYDKTKSIIELKKEITELQTENVYNIKYFQYIKGKINNENQINNLLDNKKLLVNVKGLGIHNGYVGKANLTDGLRVNFAKIQYNSGSYFILGSPIIYTTY